MKVELDELGQLIITPETPIEAYALKKWCEDNPEGKEVIDLCVMQQ